MRVNLAPILRRRNVKQSELADSIGVSRGYISELVSGKKEPSTEMLRKIASELDVSPAELFDSQFSQSNSTGELINETGGLSESSDAFFVSKEKVAQSKEAALGALSENDQTTVLKCTKTLLGFGILEGDKIVVDMRLKRSLGKLAVVTKADLQTGEGQIFIKRIEAAAVHGPDPLHQGESWQSRHHNYAVLGTVVGVIRGF